VAGENASGLQGQGQGAQRGQMQFASFRAGVFEALGYAALAASLAAVAVGFFFSRRIVSPLREMMQASQRISDGHYDERVKVSGEDELTQLAAQFNQMAEKLEQTESMRRRLIGDVSHELRTPLTAIKGSMEGLIDGVLPSTNETFEQIFQEADRLGRLVDDLQEISRVEAHAYQMDVRPLAVSTLVQTVARRLHLPFEEKRIALTLDLPADLPPVLADEDRLIQILTNLMANALQYTPPAGAVKVAARHENGFVHFSVQDTGVGIPPGHLDHIFDRFYRVDKSRSRQAGGGSGIGLTIARHLVEAHGGRIWAESAGDGQGSTFQFTIPFA
jgi:histidine kinase